MIKKDDVKERFIVSFDDGYSYLYLIDILYLL